MDSWTEDDEKPVDKPRLKELLEEDPRWVGRPIEAPPQFYPQPDAEQVRRQLIERQQLLQAELEHLTKLRDLVQDGIDHGKVELEAGVTMLLNISKARCALGGGVYPGAW